jgi:3-dehydroquinate dehydratase-2
MMKKILVMNGPNLNLLGTREPEKYGDKTLADVEVLCTAAASKSNYTVEFFQSNHEGELIEKIHEAGKLFKAGQLKGVVFNPGAYTHTSIALHDAIAGVGGLPVIEVHISNVYAREAFRHQSYVSPVAVGVLAGFGISGYCMAIDALIARN